MFKKRAVDKEGNSVSFENKDMFGFGFKSIHMIKGEYEDREDRECFIDNIACYAQENRFGGIIVQAL